MSTNKLTTHSHPFALPAWALLVTGLLAVIFLLTPAHRVPAADPGPTSATTDETIPAPAWSEPGPNPGRGLFLTVTTLGGLLIGTERWAAWRLGVRHRRGALDVSSALFPAGQGSTRPPVGYPLTWRGPGRGHRFAPPEVGTHWGGRRSG